MSKELQALETIKNIKITAPLDSYVDYETTVGEYYEGFVEEIQSALEQKEKLERVLEIIKKHPMTAGLDFKYSYEEQCEFYSIAFFDCFSREPEEKFYCTEEEYNLLKEMLKCQKN